jgi:ABC-2 type transport system ATP-binding protein
MLQFENYRKQYGKTEIISIPKLTLNAGVYWLKGENGAGKSTLMRSIAGLIPYEGDIIANGSNIRTDRRNYTLSVNQAEAEPLYPDFLTGLDLISFYQQTKGQNKSPDTKTLQLLGVTSFADRKTGTYSSGMAKKLSLALAFIGEPKWILLDEPLITLDTNTVTVLRDIIRRKSAEGTSFIISSHQELDIEGISTERIQIINKRLERI